MKKNTNDPSKDFSNLILYLFAVILIWIPLMINTLFINGNIKTANGLGNAEWLYFWGSYIGSGLGVIVTIIAFLLTFRQNAKQNRDVQEQNKIIQEQNKIIQQQNLDAQNLAKVQMRLQSLPFINVMKLSSQKLHISDRFIFDANGIRVDNEEGENINLYYIFRNIGTGPAIDVSISTARLGHFSIDTEELFIFIIPAVDTLSFEIKYHDREGREYKQTMVISKYEQNEYNISMLSVPELV